MTVALLTSQQPSEALALGTAWARDGEDVTVVLLDAATVLLRPGHDDASGLRDAASAGVRLWAHDHALAEHLIDPAGTPVDPVDLDHVAALIGDPAARVQWW